MMVSREGNEEVGERRKSVKLRELRTVRVLSTERGASVPRRTKRWSPKSTRLGRFLREGEETQEE